MTPEQLYNQVGIKIQTAMPKREWFVPLPAVLYHHKQAMEIGASFSTLTNHEQFYICYYFKHRLSHKNPDECMSESFDFCALADGTCGCDSQIEADKAAILNMMGLYPSYPREYWINLLLGLLKENLNVPFIQPRLQALS